MCVAPNVELVMHLSIRLILYKAKFRQDPFPALISPLKMLSINLSTPFSPFAKMWFSNSSLCTSLILSPTCFRDCGFLSSWNLSTSQFLPNHQAIAICSLWMNTPILFLVRINNNQHITKGSIQDSPTFWYNSESNIRNCYRRVAVGLFLVIQSSFISL